MLSPESNLEFTKARQRAFIEEWLSFFTGRSSDLLPFEEVKQSLQLQDSAYKGLQEIELDKIVGSTGRYRDFTRTFLPKSDRDQQRWRRIDDVARSEQGYPPIEVYQVGEVYFVRDGNHRVSVARAHYTKTIEAYVIEYKTSVPIDQWDNLDDILLKMERIEFFEETKLDELRPEQDVRFTEPGRYRLVREHIAFHKYLKETECGCELTSEAAAGSWYDQVYMPLIQLIREREVLKHFPNRTEADLYAWLILHRAALEEEMEALGYIPNEDVLEVLKREKSTNPFTRLVSLFQRRLDLQDMPLKVERAKFLEATHLDQIRPEHNIVVKEPGGYQLIQEHITVHKYLKEIECSCEIPYEAAVASWYDHVYLPLVQLIHEREVLRYFPSCTETDLYVWLVLRRAALEEEMAELGRVPNEEIIEDLEKEIPTTLIARLAHFLQSKLNPQRVLLPLG